MLLRISLIVAILAGLAVGALNFLQIKTKVVAVMAERDDWHVKYTDTDTKLTSTKKDLDKSTKELASTKQTLQGTKAERDKAVASEATAVKRAGELTDQMTVLQKNLGDTQAKLVSYEATGLTAGQVLTLNKGYKQAQENLAILEAEKIVIMRTLELTQAKLAKYTDGEEKIVNLRADLKGTIVVADPKWDFVVVDVGETQGAKENGELLVNRNGKLVAKVKIRNVQKDRSIANVMTGWKLGEVLEGDQVIPAHPEIHPEML